MALNREITEFTASGLELKQQQAMARVACDSWNQNDMQALTRFRSGPCVPDEFGTLELVDDKPTLLAKVDARLDRTTGTLTVKELDANAHHKKDDTLAIHVWSGNENYGIGYPAGQGADGRYDNVHDHGPIPTGEYLIGNGYTEPKISVPHPQGDAHWYRLYGRDGKGGFAYDPIANGRGAFNIHTGLESDGCVTVPSEVGQNDARYPKSDEYNKLKDFLDSTTPFEYKRGDTFKGTLYVK